MKAGMAMDSDTYMDKVTIVGAGVMGTAIATTVIINGISVHLVDTDDVALSAAPARISNQVRHAQLVGITQSDKKQGCLTTAKEVDGQLKQSMVVIEAIVESSERKRKVLEEIADQVDAGTPLITNTSGIPIGELADTSSRPQDIVGTHFMNPAYLIAMVEVISGPRSSTEVLDKTEKFLAKIGRESIVVQDSPGFVTSRLLHPMINEAARIVDRGIASADAVDKLMQGCLGHPTGPLRTADLIGIDNLVDALQALHERTGDDYYKPSGVLLHKVINNELGRKTGRGFYEY
ncbi:3-hydroxyacyl-CoA dehydrogenase family protein [Nocardia sp. NPDC050697]|uniref:3-hydroxyacyl-CoA dehydrogenase family protein n=1 Tax=Nocardia sp. NPDC050697 TaxID=3155158 RepID=UPI0033F31376